MKHYLQYSKLLLRCPILISKKIRRFGDVSSSKLPKNPSSFVENTPDSHASYSGKVFRRFWKDLGNQRQFFDFLAKKLDIKNDEDWYRVKLSDVNQHGGSALLNSYFDSSLVKALQTVYPDKQWLVWKFEKVPKGFWEEKTNQKEFIEWTMKELNIKKDEDWYSVKPQTIKDMGGAYLLEQYGSLIKILRAIFPEREWRYDTVPKGYWEDMENQREYFEWLAGKLNIKEKDDWYNIKAEDVIKIGGFGLLNERYKGSLVKALMSVYPNYNWEIWKFEQVPKGFWMEKENRRNFLENLGKQLGIREPEQWLHIKTSEIASNKGNGFLKYYKGSFRKALLDIYPNINLNKEGTSSNLEDKTRQIQFFKELEIKLEINKKEDWYKVQQSDVIKLGGSAILSQYNHSLIKALQAIYPDHNWQPWKFDKVPQGFWKDENNARSFLEAVSKEMNFSSPRDLYTLSEKQFQELKGGTLIASEGSLKSLLTKFYPEQNPLERKSGPSKTQVLLYRMMKNLFPNQDVHLDYRRADLVFPENGSPMELDIFLPSIGLAFEFHGPQHFRSHFIGAGQLETQQKRDKEKRKLCESKGIMIIEIPYWWDHSLASLKATIHKLRPDLIKDPESGSPIPEEMPLKPKRSYSSDRTDIYISHHQKWNNKTDPTGWYLSTCYDGIRVYWNGSGKLYFESGEVIKIPSSFLQKLPSNISLDGMLWSKNHDFYQIMNMIKSEQEDSWKNLTFIAIDTPQNNMKLEKRYESIKSKMKEQILLSDLEKCTGFSHLQKYLEDSIKKGGKNVLLRRPNAYYYEANSFYKTLENNEYEALVVNHVNNRILCKLPGNQEFSLESRGIQPPVHSILSFSCNEFDQRGSPIDPSFLKIREDLDWEIICQRSSLPYRLTTGRTVGPIPKCKACKSKLERNKPRIEIVVVIAPFVGGPFPAKFRFCPNSKCVNSTINDYEARNIHSLMPPFNNKVGVELGYEAEFPDDLECVIY